MAVFGDSLFDNNSSTTINLDSPIQEHSQWICHHVYSQNYKNGAKRTEHGARHVTLAALYSLMWANLRRRHGDPSAIALTERQMKLIQIASLWHDSGREGDGEDLWDNDSAINLYKYLTLTLGVSHEEAKPLAEAVANKDYYPDDHKKRYQELILGQNNAVKFIDSSERPNRTIAQKLVHDADCLEILRARDNFDSTYLDFYKDYCHLDSQSLAATELSLVVAEARQLTLQQGDLMRNKDAEVRAIYNNDIEVYNRHQNDLRDFRILQQLAISNKLHDAQYLESLVFQYVPSCRTVGKTLTLENIHGLMDGSDEVPYLLFRGIGAPSAKVSKEKYDSAATLEIRKMLRPNNGNMGRSTTLLPSETYTRSGLLIVVEEADFKYIQDVSEKDSGTGVGKKTHLVSKSMKPEMVKQRLQELSFKQRLGKSDNVLDSKDLKLCHSEILMILLRHMVKGIGFSRDFSTFNSNVLGDALKPVHSDVGLLEAHFIQQVYLRESGECLPIFEISYYSNQLRQITLSDSRLERAWQNVCGAYIDKELREGRYFSLAKCDVDTLKINTIYGSRNNFRAKENQSVDLLYKSDLKDKINRQIEVLVKSKLEEYTAKFSPLMAKYQPGTCVDQFFKECANALHLKDDEFVFLLVNIRLNNQDLKSSVDHLLSEYLKLILKGDVDWLKYYINKDGFIVNFQSVYKPDNGSRKIVTLFHLLYLNGELNKYIQGFCDNFTSQIKFQKGSKKPIIVASFYEFLDEMIQMGGGLLGDAFQSIVKNVSSIVSEHFDEILNSSEMGFSELFGLTKINSRYLEEAHVGLKLWNKIKEKIQQFDLSSSSYCQGSFIIELLCTDELRFAFKEKINSFFEIHQSVGTIIKVIQEVEQNPSDDLFEKMLDSLILKASLDRSMGFISDVLEKIQAALPNRLFSSSQKDIIKNLLLTLCKRDVYKITDLSAIINSFILIESVDAIPLPIAQKYFFAYLYYNQLNIWAPPNPNLDRIFRHFFSLGVNIEDVKKKVIDTVDNFVHQNNTQVSKIDYETQIRDMGLKKIWMTSYYIDRLSEIRPGEPKFPQRVREDINEERSLSETQKNVLLKIADDMCKYYKAMNEAIDFLTSQSGLVDPIYGRDKIIKLVCSYYDQVTTSNLKAPVSSQSTSLARLSAEVPAHNDRLKQSVRKNTEESVEAAIKIQSFFRRRQAQKALIQLKAERDEQARQKFEREQTRVQTRLKKREPNAYHLRPGLLEKKSHQSELIPESTGTLTSRGQAAHAIQWGPIIRMVMFCMLGILGFGLFTLGVASGIGIPFAMTLTGALFSFLPWSGALTAAVIGFTTHIVSGFCVGATDVNPPELPHAINSPTTKLEFDESARLTTFGSEIIQQRSSQLAKNPVLEEGHKGRKKHSGLTARDRAAPRKVPQSVPNM